eukprot:g11810.t1
MLLSQLGSLGAKDGIANIYFPLEHALEHASQEAELARIKTKEQIKATLPDLLEIFSALDQDGSGYITLEEVANVPLHVLPQKVYEKVTVDSMEDMFELLDADGGGSLSLAEFLEGLLSVLLMDMPSWAVQLQKLAAASEATNEPVVLALPAAECASRRSQELRRLRSPDSDASMMDANDTSPAAEMRRTLRQTTDGRLPKLLEEVLTDHQGKRRPKLTVWQERRETLKMVVDSTAFEYLTGMLILMNIALIGVEAEMDLLGKDTWWAADIERIFLGLYTVELLIRLTAGGREAFHNSWFLLDLFLVCVGLVALVVVPLVEQEASSQEGWMQLLIVRGLRLLRLARVLRTVKRFKVVWRLVNGLLSVWDTMASTTILIFLALYIFGCIAVEVIANDPDLKAYPETAGIVRRSFSSLPKATLTLLQFEHALEHASQEAELARIRTKEQIKATLPDLLEIFSALDQDGSGYITREEVANVPLHVLPEKVYEKVTVDSMEDMFELLDADGGGSLSLAEFLEGLFTVLLLDMPAWALQLQKLLMPLRRQTYQISKELEALKPGCTRDQAKRSHAAHRAGVRLSVLSIAFQGRAQRYSAQDLQQQILERENDHKAMKRDVLFTRIIELQVEFRLAPQVSWKQEAIRLDAMMAEEEDVVKKEIAVHEKRIQDLKQEPESVKDQQERIQGELEDEKAWHESSREQCEEKEEELRREQTLTREVAIQYKGLIQERILDQLALQAGLSTGPLSARDRFTVTGAALSALPVMDEPGLTLLRRWYSRQSFELFQFLLLADGDQDGLLSLSELAEAMVNSHGCPLEPSEARSTGVSAALDFDKHGESHLQVTT